MPVIAKIDTYFANSRFKNGITKITGTEIKLLPKPGMTMREMGFAIFAKKPAIGINHSRCVVVDSRSINLVNGNDEHHS